MNNLSLFLLMVILVMVPMLDCLLFSLVPTWKRKLYWWSILPGSGLFILYRHLKPKYMLETITKLIGHLQCHTNNKKFEVHFQWFHDENTNHIAAFIYDEKRNETEAFLDFNDKNDLDERIEKWMNTIETACKKIYPYL